LCALRSLGEAVDLHLTPAHYTRQLMTADLAQNIIALLGVQPYIRQAQFTAEIKVRRPDRPIPPHKVPVDRNFDDFRRLFKYYDGWVNLANMQRLALGLGPCNPYEPWLSVPQPRCVYPVILHRSLRYHNPQFNWPAVAEKYEDCAGVVGTDQEHQALCAHAGRTLPHVPTTDLLELAQAIAGCRLFVGNQSCPYAIAEGLKRPTVQEVFVERPNCLFARHTARYGWDASLQLPEV
jgi:hypothetical protein